MRRSWGRGTIDTPAGAPGAFPSALLVVVVPTACPSPSVSSSFFYLLFTFVGQPYHLLLRKTDLTHQRAHPPPQVRAVGVLKSVTRPLVLIGDFHSLGFIYSHVVAGAGNNTEAESLAVALPWGPCRFAPLPAAEAMWSVCPVMFRYVNLPSALAGAAEEEHDDISSLDLTLSPPQHCNSSTFQEDPGQLMVVFCPFGLPQDLTGCISSSPDA